MPAIIKTFRFIPIKSVQFVVESAEVDEESVRPIKRIDVM